MKIMKTKAYAEETEGYSLDNKSELSITFVHEAQSEEMVTVLERVVEATLQSGIRFMKHNYDSGKGKEHVFLDAEDCSTSVVSSFISDLKDEDFDLDFRATQRSMDHLVVVYQDESLKVEESDE